MIKFTQFEDAFDAVSSDMYGANRALLNRDTGKTLYRLDFIGLDEIAEAEIDGELDKWVDIPHKNDLGLGRDLVFEFIEDRLPEKSDYVNKIFHRRGAYSRYKELLDSVGLLQAWYDFENSRTEEALRQWCRRNDIQLED